MTSPATPAFSLPVPLSPSRIGSIVRYHPRPDEPPTAGVVLGEWPDGSYQLYVFHFEASTHIRVALPSEVTFVIDVERLMMLPDILADFDERMDGLRREIELLHVCFNQAAQPAEPKALPQPQADTHEEADPQAREEHEGQRQRIAETIANGARRSRNPSSDSQLGAMLDAAEQDAANPDVDSTPDQPAKRRKWPKQ